MARQSHLVAIWEGFRSNRLLYALGLLTLAIAISEAQMLGMALDIGMVAFFTGPVVLVLAFVVLGGLAAETVRLARTGHQGSALQALWVKLRDDYLAPARVSNAVHAVAFMSLCMVGYTFIKKAIPVANPFSWDEAFMYIDRNLHFGSLPHEWLAPLFNVPLVTFLLNVNYNAWFFVMFALWFWQGFAATDHKLRQQFLASFALTWLLGGGLLGTVFSSAGPCFYDKLIPAADPYQPLMAWLAEANQSYPIWGLPVMDELWKSYASGHGLVNGISAMPSMHVATSVLFVLLGFASGKNWLGWLLSAFAALIMLGSVHLGWHYAADGYAGALIAVGCWWLSGRLVDVDRKLRGLA